MLTLDYLYLISFIIIIISIIIITNPEGFLTFYPNPCRNTVDFHSLLCAVLFALGSVGG